MTLRSHVKPEAPRVFATPDERDRYQRQTYGAVRNGYRELDDQTPSFARDRKTLEQLQAWIRACGTEVAEQYEPPTAATADGAITRMIKAAELVEARVAELEAEVVRLTLVAEQTAQRLRAIWPHLGAVGGYCYPHCERCKIEEALRG